MLKEIELKRNIKTKTFARRLPGLILTVLSAALSLRAEPGLSQPLFSHPVMEHNLSEGNRSRFEKEVAPLMSLRDEELLALVPTQTPLIKSACPYCGKGKPHDKKWDNATATMFDYIWEYKNPNQIQCKTCETIFPNQQFPMNRTDVLYNPAGNPVEISYYFDPDKTVYGFPGQTGGKTGRKYYLHGVVDYAKWRWLFPKLESLAKLYHITRDEKYARPAVLILKQYSQLFQDYLLTTDYGHTYATTKNREMPYGWEDTRWGRRCDEETMESLLAVVDLVYASKAMDQISAESQTDVRKELWKVFESGLKRRLYLGYSNFHGQFPGAKDFLPLAKVFGNIDLVHLVFQTYYDLPRYNFASDGSYLEGTGYGAIQQLMTAQLREEDGYSDPAGYKGTNRLDHVYPFAGREEFYQKTYDFLMDLRYPDGNVPVIQDGAPFLSIFDSKFPRAASSNRMKTGYKHLLMGAGKGDEQIQVHIGFGQNSENHSRQDTLGLQLYAFARPLIDVFPYHKSKLRRFSEMTISHNAVVVDHQNQEKTYSDADPLLYVDDMPGLCAFSADGARVYRGLTSKYKRTLVLNTVDLKHPYLIDVFQVAGGKTHDYMLQSSSQFPQTAQSSLMLEPMRGMRPLLPPGEVWTEPVAQRASVGSGYGLFFDVKRADAEPVFNIDFVCENPWDVKQLEGAAGMNPHSMKYIPFRFDPASWPENARVGVRSHVAGQKGQQIFLTHIPALNRRGFYGEENAPSEDWEKMPQFILRSEQPDGKSESLFVVIHEPFYDEPGIESVRQIEVGDPHVLLLEIQYKEGRRDRFIYSLNMKPVQVKHNDLEFSGIMGLVATGSAGKSDAYLIGGDSLKADAGKVNLKADTASYVGEVVGSSRTWDQEQKENAFIVQSDMNLPEGTALAGQWIILKLHGSWDAYTNMDDRTFKKAIKKFPLDGKSKIWGLDDQRIWNTFYKDIEPSRETPAEHLAQMQGGGYCFQIARIEKRNGKILIHTTEDHGLIIREGSVQEYFYPCRLYNGNTTFEIHAAVGTQAAPVVSPAGGAFMGSVEVACQLRDPSKKILIAVTAPSARPVASDWSEYSGPLHITQDADLHVKSSSANTLRDAEVFTYRFTAAMEPVAEPSKTAPGLIRKMHVTGSSLEPDGLPNKVEVVNGIDAEDLVKQIGRRSPGKLVFSGMLRIDYPGIYTFHYLADRDGILRIGDNTLLAAQPHLGAAPLSRRAEVALKKGLYPVYFELIVSKEFPRWDPALKLEWSAQGVERQPVPSGNLWHDRDAAEKALSLLDKSVVSPRITQAAGGTRPTMYRGTISAVDVDKKTLTLKLREKNEELRVGWNDATRIELLGRVTTLDGLPEGLDVQLEGLTPEQLRAAEQQKALEGVTRVTVFQTRGEIQPGILKQYSRICGILIPSEGSPNQAVLNVQGQQIPFTINSSGSRIHRMSSGTHSSFSDGIFVQCWAEGAEGGSPVLSHIILSTNP